MCTEWTMSKFIRWRARDWVSCLLACRLPLEDEENSFRTANDHQEHMNNLVFGVKDESRANRSAKKLSRQNGCRRDREVRSGNGSPQQAMHKTANTTVPIERKRSDSSWPSFQDEDYIVFCFGEDGGFDVVKDCTSQVLDEHYNFLSQSSIPRPINRKLHYDEVAEIVRKESQEKKSNTNAQNVYITEKVIVPVHKGQEKKVCEMETVGMGSGRRTRRDQSDQDSEKSGTASTESRDSNKSDGSVDSFSFPVLQSELMGSPVQMPTRSEDLHLRKHRVPCARFQCFRIL